MKAEVKKIKMNHQEITSKDHKEQRATLEEALITDQMKEEMSTDHLWDPVLQLKIEMEEEKKSSKEPSEIGLL